jgi:hypothetical protein
MTAILTKEPEELSRHGLEVPASLERIVRRCLDKDPAERFHSARDVAFALEAASGTGPAARTVDPAPARRGRHVASVAALVTLGSLVTTALVVWRRPLAVPRVTAIHLIAHDGMVKGGVLTDGTRVYYTAFFDSRSRLFQVPVTGGDPAPLETPFRRPYLQDILTSRNELLVEDDVRATVPDRVWRMSTTGGSLRPLGDIEAQQSAWSADGRQVVYAKGKDLFLARSDGSGSRRLLTAPRSVSAPRLSPDGRRVRYVVEGGDAGSESTSLWETAVDGSDAHALFPGWSTGSGCWTPDGRHYVFSAERDGATSLWARREEGRWPWSGPPSTGPARLTTGPMCYFGPTVSPDGRTLFALGRPPGAGGELVRYDARGRLFAPFLDGRSIRDVEFSRDGAWIAYVRHPDGTLWRSRADGTGGLQLSFSPHTASLPRWSPDGRRIAYTSLSPDGQWEVRVVAAEAGEPQAVPAEPDLPRPRRVSSSPGAKLCPWA